MNSPRVLIAILNYNRRDDLVKCIDSVLELDYCDYDVVVVDNGSRDDPGAILTERYGNRIRMRCNDENLGTAGGYNVCIDEGLKSGAEYLFLLNNDVVLDRSALAELIKVAGRLPGPNVLGGKVYFQASGEVWSYGGTVNPWFGQTSHITCDATKGYKDVDYIPGAAMLIPLEIVGKVGLFDEDYFMYWEDVDFCTRIRRSGYRNVVVAESTIYHRVGCAEGKYTALTTYYPLRNRFLYAKKHILGVKRATFCLYSAILLVQKLTAVILGRVVRGRSGCIERTRAVLQAYFDSLRGRYGRRT